MTSENGTSRPFASAHSVAAFKSKADVERTSPSPILVAGLAMSGYVSIVGPESQSEVTAATVYSTGLHPALDEILV